MKAPDETCSDLYTPYYGVGKKLNTSVTAKQILIFQPWDVLVEPNPWLLAIQITGKSSVYLQILEMFTGLPNLEAWVRIKFRMFTTPICILKYTYIFLNWPLLLETFIKCQLINIECKHDRFRRMRQPLALHEIECRGNGSCDVRIENFVRK